ncbi:MAG: hypothetical protein HQ582_33390 [Planctomycetes bacterium]|nr:hypothetical protein [Planctomycetota bacterium]
MTHGPADGTQYELWPRWWRMVVVGLCTLILCSCRGPHKASAPVGPISATPPALPQQGFMKVPGAYPGVVADPAMAGAAVGPWAPPGLAADPWPADEYLSDGGDSSPAAKVHEDWQIGGLDVEDTVGHFDTVDGRRIVTPSNRVSIYSPRFGAVRQVVGLRQDEQRTAWSGIHQPLKLVQHDEAQIAANSKQNVQAEAQLSRKLATTYYTEQGDGIVSTSAEPLDSRSHLLPREKSLLIRQAVFEEAEMAWLADGVTAARAWEQTESVQVMIDRTRAIAETGDEKTESVYTIYDPPGNPKLRVLKLASTEFAPPGETVDFTLRFDNVGDEVIGNVTIVDNLTTRLEYVPDSAECSVPAEFSTQPSDSGSLVLRWEISDPLQPEGLGVIRFRCRVR